MSSENPNEQPIDPEESSDNTPDEATGEDEGFGLDLTDFDVSGAPEQPDNTVKDSD